MTYKEFAASLPIEERARRRLMRWARYVPLAVSILRLMCWSAVPISWRRRMPFWIWYRWQLLCGRAVRHTRLGDEEILVGRFWLYDAKRLSKWETAPETSFYLRCWMFRRDLKEERARWIPVYGPGRQSSATYGYTKELADIKQARRNPIVLVPLPVAHQIEAAARERHAQGESWIEAVRQVAG